MTLDEWALAYMLRFGSYMDGSWNEEALAADDAFLLALADEYGIEAMSGHPQSKQLAAWRRIFPIIERLLNP